ncbi:MAG: lamin tail domain-containing protein, partial [Clostridia bacterium]|nr:lamin tail domain-containing protein [Clostridia bacterium]
MKKLSVFLAVIMMLAAVAGCNPSDLSHRSNSENLSISEVMADNEKLILGHNLDWVEIYNKGESDISLDGYFLSDDSADLSKHSLNGYVAPAGGYVVIELGPEAAFHLSSNGETVYLSCGGQLVSQLQFAASQNGESFGAEGALPYPTPGFANTEEGYTSYLATVKAPDLVINEVIASNSKYLPQGGEFFDIVEIKNNSANPINLAEYCLSDKGKELERYKFPEVNLQPGEFYVVYCSGNTSWGAAHASFKISIAQQETIYLSKAGVVIDAVTLPADLIENESYGRAAAGFNYYSAPTPGKANGEGHQTGVSAPTASVPTGVYASAQDVVLSGKGTIYYTLDGSRPNETSPVYKNPIHIDSQSGAVTIRTYCVDGTRKSALAAYTYVVGVQHDLPVLTVSIPDSKLNGETDGILNHIFTTYEYESQVTLIEGGEQKFTVACGFRLHGSGSRKMPKQNFQLRFRSEYGSEKLEYKLFENRNFDEFDSLLLKGGSED